MDWINIIYMHIAMLENVQTTVLSSKVLNVKMRVDGLSCFPHQPPSEPSLIQLRKCDRLVPAEIKLTSQKPQSE